MLAVEILKVILIFYLNQKIKNQMPQEIFKPLISKYQHLNDKLSISFVLIM
jgi:hypothetical protein